MSLIDTKNDSVSIFIQTFLIIFFPKTNLQIDDIPENGCPIEMIFVLYYCKV